MTDRVEMSAGVCRRHVTKLVGLTADQDLMEVVEENVSDLPPWDRTGGRSEIGPDADYGLSAWPTHGKY